MGTLVASDGHAGVEGRRQLVVAPNASLTPIRAAAFLVGMCLVSFAIAGAFASLGYWLVLPFAGLEMLALAAALYWVIKANAYREVISITEDRIRIEAGRRKPQWSWEFPRAWTRVTLEKPNTPCDRGRLWIVFAGGRCEIGACLGEEQRESLALRLRELLAQGK